MRNNTIYVKVSNGESNVRENGVLQLLREYRFQMAPFNHLYSNQTTMLPVLGAFRVRLKLILSFACQLFSQLHN